MHIDTGRDCAFCYMCNVRNTHPGFLLQWREGSIDCEQNPCLSHTAFTV